jgi:hypothetical protein
MTTLRKEFTTFFSGEAAAITGASEERQRGWRKCGALPSCDGGRRYARFDVFGLATLLALRTVGDATGSLKEARKWCPFLPAAIAAKALAVPGAIEGDAEEFELLERFLLKEAHNLRRRRSWRTLLA